MRRGAEVMRTDTQRKPGPGMQWQARFTYRSKMRTSDIELVELAEKSALGFKALSPNIQADARVELMEMSTKRTRIHVTLDVVPRSLGARLFLQSLRLARARIDRKFEARVAQLAAEIEQRYRQNIRKV
jgi:uncharacterized protein (DUF2164 family)